MSRLPVRQSVAERWTRVAFACAMLAALGTAAIFVLPPPKTPTTKSAAGTQSTSAQRKPPKAPSEGVSKEWPLLASAVDGLNAPAIAMWEEEQARLKAEQAAAAASGQPATVQPSGVTSGFAPPWRYLGSISDGEQRVALVVIDGRQRFVREGYYSQNEGYRVLTIEAERLIVEQGSARHEIRLEEAQRAQGFNNTAAAQPRPAPYQFEAVNTIQGGVKTSSGDTTPRTLSTEEPLSAQRAKQGLRGTPVQPGSGGGGDR
ncbi:MAG: hypothetical protein AB7G17_00645 [Phycisphaerales bacterium]